MAVDPQNGGSRESDLPEEVVEDILSSARRRTMLSRLAECDGHVTVEDLAAAVCAAEQAQPPGSVDAEACQEVRTEIYDRHLPKLTATGVVKYKSMRGAVRLVDKGLAAQL